ncbi:uncharacterized protein [Cebidichthys violaceus]|uniref:uncharacterized protein n=1 Tax=Cebidichthys violaceus TaxID=271503 RepID=UPI0035CBE735
MNNFTLITALSLCSFCSECQTVEVQADGEVTLLCSNFSSSPSQIFWFRVVKGSQPRSICFIYKPPENATFSDGFKNGKFEMRTNISTVFLKIKQVNSSDSGLYFCGYYLMNNPVIFNATYLEVQGSGEPHDDGDSKCEKPFDRTAELVSLILAGLTVLLVSVIIGLAVKVKKLQKARVEEQNPPRTTMRRNQGSEELNYAALSFQPKTKRNHRPASENEEETNTIYSATR